MDVTPFAGGLLVGILIGVGATAGGAAVVVGMLIYRAPRIEYERDGEPRRLYVLPGQYPRTEPTPERGPTTHYPPYSTHHDLSPTVRPDGTVVYDDGPDR